MILFRESEEKKETKGKIAVLWSLIGPFCVETANEAAAKKGEFSDKTKAAEKADGIRKDVFKAFTARDTIDRDKITKLLGELKNRLEAEGLEVVYDEYGEIKPFKLDESLSDKELDEFVAALKKGVVDFEFEKVDGTVRKAKGTLSQDLMKVPEKRVEGAAKKRFMPPTVQVFWDVEKEEFRSCRKASITKWKAEEKEEKEDK